MSVRTAQQQRIIVTPAEQGQMGVNFIQSLHDNRDRMMPLLLPGEISDYFPPVLPGELIVVEAQTHNAKSLFMRLWARRMMAHLKDNGREDEAIVWVDTEQPAEYLATAELSSRSGITYEDVFSPNGLNLPALVQASHRMADTPLYLIATSLGSKGGGDEIHLTNVKNALAMLRDGQLESEGPRRIAAVFVDYLQSLPIDPHVRKAGIENQRRLQVSNDIDTLRRMASRLDCPVIVGVQAKQTLVPSPHARELGLPGLYDGQESANIAQRPDRIIALSVAARNFPIGETITYRNAHHFAVTERLLFVGIWKQRAVLGYRPAGHVFAFDIEDDHSDPMRALSYRWSEWRP